MALSGEDRRTRDAVAEIVAMFLQQKFSSQITTPEEFQRVQSKMVEKIGTREKNPDANKEKISKFVDNYMSAYLSKRDNSKKAVS